MERGRGRGHTGGRGRGHTGGRGRGHAGGRGKIEEVTFDTDISPPTRVSAGQFIRMYVVTDMIQKKTSEASSRNKIKNISVNPNNDCEETGVVKVKIQYSGGTDYFVVVKQAVEHFVKEFNESHQKSNQEHKRTKSFLFRTAEQFDEDKVQGCIPGCINHLVDVQKVMINPQGNRFLKPGTFWNIQHSTGDYMGLSYTIIEIKCSFTGFIDLKDLNETVEHVVKSNIKTDEFPHTDDPWGDQSEPEPETKEKLLGIIGLEVGVSELDIKKAYRRLVLKHHPDKGGDEEMFKKISDAYNKLTGK